MRFLSYGGTTRQKIAIIHPGDTIASRGTAMTLLSLPRDDLTVNLGDHADGFIAGTTRAGDTVNVNAGLDAYVDVLYAFGEPGNGLPVIYGPHAGVYMWAIGGRPPARDIGNGHTHETVKNTYYHPDGSQESLRSVTEIHGPGAKSLWMHLPEFNPDVQTLAMAGEADVYRFTVTDTIRVKHGAHAGELRSTVKDVWLTNEGHDSPFDPLHEQAVRLSFTATEEAGFRNPNNPLYIYTDTSSASEREAEIQHIIDAGYYHGVFDGNGWMALT